tara:strand:+ start:907 stop:2451 length:1545 start_codon:yes stop_codon:yes gene_type:complete
MTTLAAVVEQLQINNEEERQRDSNLNQNIAQSRRVQEQLLGGLSGTFEEFFTGQQRKAEGDKLESDKEGKKGLKGTQSFISDSLKRVGAGAEKTLKSKTFQALLAAVVIGLLSMEGVQEFIKEKLIPTIGKFFVFLKDKVFPVIKDNFGVIVGAAGIIAGLVLAIKVSMLATAGFLKIVKVMKSIAAAARMINITSKLLLRNFKRTASALAGKIYKVIVTTAQLVRAGVIATSASLKSVAASLGGAFTKVLKAMRVAATFIRVTAIPMLMTTLATVGTTLMAAMAPFLPIVLIVAAAIGAVVGIFLLIQKSIEGLGLGSMSDLLTVVFAGMKDGVNHFLNMFIAIGKKIGEIGGRIASALGFEVPEFLTNMAEMEYFDTDNASKALTEGQIKNREAIEKKIAETEEGEERDKLVKELARIDEILAKRGISPPDRKFVEVQPGAAESTNQNVDANEVAKMQTMGPPPPTIIDNTTNNNVSNDNSQSMTSQVEPPINNRRRMRGGGAIMRGKGGRF